MPIEILSVIYRTSAIYTSLYSNPSLLHQFTTVPNMTDVATDHISIQNVRQIMLHSLIEVRKMLCNVQARALQLHFYLAPVASLFLLTFRCNSS